MESWAWFVFQEKDLHLDVNLKFTSGHRTQFYGKFLTCDIIVKCWQCSMDLGRQDHVRGKKTAKSTEKPVSAFGNITVCYFTGNCTNL